MSGRWRNSTAIVLCSLMLVLAGTCPTALADPSTGQLDATFSGFTSVNDVTVSGLRSSYYTDIMQGDLLPTSLFTLGPDRVSYPSGIGTRPSPAGSIGRAFDEGMLGILVDGDNLIIRVAGGLDPRSGYRHLGWNSWYSQGDVFLTIEDTSVSHFALLNEWARDGGTPINLNQGHFNKAMNFHVAGDDGASLEGHLVKLTADEQVALVGGAGSYSPTYGGTPAGVDFRVYAQGGKDLGDAGLVHTSVVDYGLNSVQQTWYIQTWTVPMEWLSSSPEFTIGLHKAVSCGNDQIGMIAEITRTTSVPAPPAVLLGLLGVSMTGWLTARRARRQA